MPMHDQTELTALLADLVRIDSINPDLIPGANGEAEIAAFIAEWATRAGLEVILQDAAPRRPNVIVIARGSGGGKNLMLNGHIDTVGLTDMVEPFGGHVDGNKLYGHGAYDMKAGLAASMMAAKRARSLSLRGDVIVTAVADEEVASIGTQAILRELHRWRPDAVIVTEPTEMEIAVAHRGFVWFDVETFGVAAHGSRPHLGVDAIVKMGKVLVELEKHDSVPMCTQPWRRRFAGKCLAAPHLERVANWQKWQLYGSWPTSACTDGRLSGLRLGTVDRRVSACRRPGHWFARPCQRLPAAPGTARQSCP